MGGEAEGTEELRKIVNQRISEGVDVVKVMTTGK